MIDRRKKLLLTMTFCLVFGCGLTSSYIVVRIKTSVYPQVGPCKSSSFERGHFYQNGFAGQRVEVHSHFESNDSIDSVATYLDVEGWRERNFDLVDGPFSLYNGYYTPEWTEVSVGPFQYFSGSIVILSSDGKNKTMIEEISYIEIYFDLRKYSLFTK